MIISNLAIMFKLLFYVALPYSTLSINKLFDPVHICMYVYVYVYVCTCARVLKLYLILYIINEIPIMLLANLANNSQLYIYIYIDNI